MKGFFVYNNVTPKLYTMQNNNHILKEKLIKEIISLLHIDNTKLLKEEDYGEGFSLSTYIIPKNIFINVMNYNIKIYSIVINIPTTQEQIFGNKSQLGIYYYTPYNNNNNKLSFDLDMFIEQMINSFSIMDIFYIKTLLINNMF
jgi:hypothetical protein